MPKSELTVLDLVSTIGGDLHGKQDLVVSKFSSLAKANFGEGAFATKQKNIDEIYSCNASLLVIYKEQPEVNKIIRTRTTRGLATVTYLDPYLFFAQASTLINNFSLDSNTQIDIHPSAIVDKSVVLKKGVQIGPGCVIEPEVKIGEFSKIKALSFIGKKSTIGSKCFLHPRTTVLSNVFVGDNVIFHSGSVVGSEGFGYVLDANDNWVKLPQDGYVRICDNVEIGANTTIDKGTFDSTTINSGTKLDNQVHIAHNVKVGKNTAIAGCVGVAGSADIGNQCQIGGAAGILGHLKICDKAVIGPMSLVLSNINKPGKYVGVYPLQTDKEWKRSSSIIRKLNALRKKLFTVKN